MHFHFSKNINDIVCCADTHIYIFFVNMIILKLNLKSCAIFVFCLHK